MSLIKLDSLDVDPFSCVNLNAEGNQEIVIQQFPLKELFFVGIEDSNGSANPYFILSSGDIPIVTDNASFTPAFTNEAVPITKINNIKVLEKSSSENEAQIFEDIRIFNKESVECSNETQLESVESQLPSQSSDENVDHKKLENEDSNFYNQITKRNSLLPSKRAKISSKKDIVCDKCKLVFHSASKYYIHQKFHMQKGGNFRWYCAQCGKSFGKLTELKNHEIKIHGEIRMYPCPHCVHSFRTLKSMENHISNIHHREKKFKCELCDRGFFSIHDLKMHLNVHLNIKSYICDLCGKQFTHSSNLARHARTHTKIKPFSCEFCSRRFSQIPSLNAHKISHTSGSTCRYCSAKFYSISGIRSHLKNVHNKKISNRELYLTFLKTTSNHRLYSCSVCSQRFRFIKELRIHEAKVHLHKPIPCVSCFSIFPHIESFKTHKCISVQKVGMSDKGTYECAVCHTRCQSYEESLEHVCIPKTVEKENVSSFKIQGGNGALIKEALAYDTIVMHISSNDRDPEVPLTKVNLDITKPYALNESHIQTTSVQVTKISSNITEPPVGNNRNNQTTLPCTQMPKALLSSSKNASERTSNNDKIDSRIEIMKDEAKYPFKCLDCLKTFSKKWNWKQHRALHDPSLREYACKNCGKTFSYKSTYNNHLNSCCGDDSGKIQFPCTQCPKVYKSKGSLSQHVRRFHEKRCNYSCTLCSKGFFNKTEHAYHMRIHNKEYPYMCATCGSKFSHVSHLHRHERVHRVDKPHKCPHCPKQFIQLVTLKVHLRKHGEMTSADTTFPPGEVDSDTRQADTDTRQVGSDTPQITSEVVDDRDEAYFAVINLDLAPILATQFSHESEPLKTKIMNEYDIDINDISSL